MGSERFFLDQPPDGAEARLTGDEARHLRRVRRVKVGDEVVLFDGSGVDYVGRVEAFDRAGVAVRILRREHTQREPVVAVTLVVAVVKQQAMHRLIDMCTQLGVRRLAAVQTERSVAKAGAGKPERWRRIAIEACKQCGRSVVPEILAPRGLAEALALAEECDTAFVASVRPDARPLLSALDPGARTALGVIGPEGGLTDEEEAAAISAGCVPVSLGRSVLRTETAAAAALAVVLQVPAPLQ